MGRGRRPSFIGRRPSSSETRKHARFLSLLLFALTSRSRSHIHAGVEAERHEGGIAHSVRLRPLPFGLRGGSSQQGGPPLSLETTPSNGSAPARPRLVPSLGLTKASGDFKVPALSTAAPPLSHGASGIPENFVAPFTKTKLLEIARHLRLSAPIRGSFKSAAKGLVQEMVAVCMRPQDVREALSLAIEEHWQALTCADDLLGANAEETIPLRVEDRGIQAQVTGARVKEEKACLQDMSDLILLAQHLLLPLSPAVDVAEPLQQPFALRAVRLLVRTSLLSSQGAAPAFRAVHMCRGDTGIEGRVSAPGLCFDGQSKVPVAIVCAQQAFGALGQLQGELGCRDVALL